MPVNKCCTKGDACAKLLNVCMYIHFSDKNPPFFQCMHQLVFKRFLNSFLQKESKPEYILCQCGKKILFGCIHDIMLQKSVWDVSGPNQGNITMHHQQYS